MQTNKKINEIERAYSNVINKYWEDEGFRKELTKNPRKTLGEMNFSFRPETEVIVRDQTNPAHIYLNIPRKPEFDFENSNANDMELSDEELEFAAGGEIGWTVGAVIIGLGATWYASEYNRAYNNYRCGC